MKDWAISFCDGAYRTMNFENLYEEDKVASVGFEPPVDTKCHYSCDTCETGATDVCITCGVNRVGEPDCPCKDGYFEAEGSEECTQCSIQCLTCTDSADNCDSCAGNRVNYPDCDCPSTATYDTGEAICPSCPDECLECEADGTCITCAAHRTGTDCTCEEGHYETIILGKKVCEICDVRCEECTSTYYNCDECAVGSLRTEAPECNCPSGYYDPCGDNEFHYPDGSDYGTGSVTINMERCSEGACVKCATECYTCDNTNTCTECESPRVGLPECPCPDHYYSDEDGNCADCNYKCETCSNIDTCDTCRSDVNRI